MYYQSISLTLRAIIIIIIIIVINHHHASSACILTSDVSHSPKQIFSLCLCTLPTGFIYTEYLSELLISLIIYSNIAAV